MRIRIFFITYVAANLSLVAYGVLILISPAVLVDSFLQGVYPLPREAATAVDYLAALFRLLGFFNLSLGILGLLLLRQYALGLQRWILQVVIASSLLAYLGPIVFDNTVGHIGVFEIIEHALFIAMILTGIIMLAEREQGIVAAEAQPGHARMKEFSFWQGWLLIVGILLSVFGMLMAFLSGTPLFELFKRQIDLAFWSANSVEDGARLFQQWIYGVWGATIAGWGVFTSFIARYPFRNGEKWAWNCLAAGLLVWFLLDTSLSVVHRVYFNVAFNLAVFVAMLLPLAFSRRYFAH